VNYLTMEVRDVNYHVMWNTRRSVVWDGCSMCSFGQFTSCGLVHVNLLGLHYVSCGSDSDRRDNLGTKVFGQLYAFISTDKGIH
jgi:hypothetical protein